MAGDARPLSPRERQVALLVAEGLPNKAIARRLGITPSTVRNHLTTVYNLLGLQSRTQLAVRVTRESTEEATSGRR